MFFQTPSCGTLTPLSAEGAKTARAGSRADQRLASAVGEMTLPEGYYYLELLVMNYYTGQMEDYVYDNASGWVTSWGANPVVYVTPGQTTDLQAFNGG